ncbi:MAG: phage tail protein [Sphingobacteriales bacterium]|nr:MAG: phage tail protein [Sphingobacteriales bacterium]
MENYLGEIRLFAGTFAPVGWLACDGSLLPISENDALFTLLGTTYGGDGQTTFGLPDLRGRVPVSQGRSTTGTTYVLGQSAGVETVTLTTAQMPAHQHTFSVSNSPGTQVSASNAYLANPVDPTTNNKTVLFYLPDSVEETIQGLLPDSLTPAGGSQPHENRMPYTTINYIIATQGIYPSQQ